MGGVVGTNINQTMLNGDIVYSTAAGQSAKLGDGESVTPKGLRWVNHDSVGYFFEPVDTVTIRNVARNGSWRDINIESYPGDKIVKKLFDLDLGHGSMPSGASYVYAVVPGISPNEMESFLADKPFTVLRNDAVAQAVTDNKEGVTEANFFAAGDVDLRPGVKLMFADREQSASVIVREKGDKLTISLASPEHRTGDLTLQLSGQYAGDGAQWDTAAGTTTFTFTLPAGPTAGSTVTQAFTKVNP